MGKQIADLPRMGRINHIHFVGIGGVGMCGIAEVLFNDGYYISGSDNVDNAVTKRLATMGITVFHGHDITHIEKADVVVQSTAVAEDNPEIIAAKTKKIPIIPRAAMLAELMRYRYGIAVAGTHGKTTTTSLVSSLLAEGGLDPSYVIGGKLNSVGSTAKLGSSPYLVVEADESDASFLYLKPVISVVTNIDEDHMGTYNGELATLRKTFIEFLHHLPFYGLAVLCLDDEHVKDILSEVKRPIVTYGFDDDADIQAVNWQQKGLVSFFEVKRKKHGENLKIRFNLPGRHNVLNALAAIAIASELTISNQAIMQALAQFQGVGRRFQVHGEINFKKGRALLIDDYGHHPREIESTIRTIRQVWPEKRLTLAFQPHRYSRTKALFNDFAETLTKVDALVLLDIYSAGESPIDGVSSQSLAEKIGDINCTLTVILSAIENLADNLDQCVCEGDIVLTQGAGSIGNATQALLKGKQELA